MRAELIRNAHNNLQALRRCGRQPLATENSDLALPQTYSVVL